MTPEAATLGGRVISRHTERQLGLNATHGARFFHGYGEQTGTRWKAFRTALSALADKPPREDQVVTSAIATFTALQMWCAADEPGHQPVVAGDLHVSRSASHLPKFSKTAPA